MLIESKEIVNSPVISILVTTYNHERYIAQCVDSILSQKINVPYELIIAEDGGRDNTRDICIQYQKAHPSVIRLLLQEKNKGLSGNYADLLSLSRGIYIAQVAGDDYWCDENKLQIQYDYMKSNLHCGLCYTDTMVCDECGNIIKKNCLHGKKISQTFNEHVLCPAFLAPSTWMFRREIKEMYKDRGYTDESVAMALEAFANFEVHGIDMCTGVYRQTPNSASSFINPDYYFKQYLGVMETQLYYAEKYNGSKELIERIKLRGYLILLPIAIMTKNDAYVEEIRNYTESIGMDISMIIRGLKDREVKKNSKAYKIGKALLKPIQWMKK